MVATKAQRSKYWFVRVDGPEEFLRQKCSVLIEKIDTVALLGAYHKGDKKDNPHCHFVIELSSEPQKQSFAVRIKDLFNVEKRSQYALDIWDGRRGAGACSYLFHEADAIIIANKGFSDSDIADAKQANEAVQRVVAVNKERASNKFVDRALEHFPDGASAYDLLRYMMELCKNGELYWPGSFRAKQLIEEVEIKLSNDVDQIASHFYNKMFL